MIFRDQKFMFCIITSAQSMYNNYKLRIIQIKTRRIQKLQDENLNFRFQSLEFGNIELKVDG